MTGGQQKSFRDVTANKKSMSPAKMCYEALGMLHHYQNWVANREAPLQKLMLIGYA